MTLLAGLCRSAGLGMIVVAVVVSLGPGIVNANAAAAGTIGSAPAINLGETVSGGGHHTGDLRFTVSGPTGARYVAIKLTKAGLATLKAHRGRLACTATIGLTGTSRRAATRLLLLF